MSIRRLIIYVLFYRIPADPDLIIKFIENAKSIINQPDADIKAGYEAGCLGYSLYWQLTERGIL